MTDARPQGRRAAGWPSKRTLSIDLDASAEDVFDLVHDYARRLDWDCMLTEARLLDGAPGPAVGVKTLCVGTWKTARAAIETEYVSFVRGKVAAVRLSGRSPFFARLAASIRHQALGPRRSRLCYTYAFVPRLRALGPILDAVLARETRLRLEGLQAYLSAGGGSDRSRRAGRAKGVSRGAS